MKRIFLLFPLFTFMVIVTTAFSCEEEATAQSINEASSNPDYTEGLILYTGEPEVDGCGYMLKIVEKIYKPLNLSADFQMDSLKVLVKYTVNEDGYQCGDMPTPKTTINIVEITKK